MILRVKKLGIIESAEMDTSKPLTIFCGPNNSGKTYLSYLLNAVSAIGPTSNYLAWWKVTLESYIMDEIYPQVKENNQFHLKQKYLNAVLSDEAYEVSQQMNVVFGIPSNSRKNFFRYMDLNLSIDDATFKRDFFDAPISDELNFNMFKVYIAKDAKSDVVRLSYSNPTGEEVNDESLMKRIILITILQRIAHYPIAESRMLTVERNSIYTFKTELSINRNELVDRLLDSRNNKEDLVNIIDSGSQRYPLAVRESLKVANDLENIQKQHSPFYDFASEIEAELLQGSIGINKNGGVEYVPNAGGKRANRLPIHMTSSIVKTLSSMIVYLKHIAKKGDLLIIDEPEMNLHPDNQRVLARIFARMVNKGLRLVISTHSDYIIREFNNLVMAHGVYGGRNPIQKDNQVYEKQEWLNPEKMAVLYFKPNKKVKVEVENIPVEKTGFAIESIDETISEQNKVSMDLYDTLLYGKQDD